MSPVQTGSVWESGECGTWDPGGGMWRLGPRCELTCPGVTRSLSLSPGPHHWSLVTPWPWGSTWGRGPETRPDTDHYPGTEERCATASYWTLSKLGRGQKLGTEKIWLSVLGRIDTNDVIWGRFLKISSEQEDENSYKIQTSTAKFLWAAQTKTATAYKLMNLHASSRNFM